MVNWKSKRMGDLLILANGFALIVLLNVLAYFYFFRIDLTEEQRFSIKPATKKLLQRLEEPVYIEVFLAGELNPSFTRFQKSIRETLEEFRIYSDNKVRFTFTDPATAVGEKARNEFMQDLASRGVQPRNVIDTRDGQRVEKIIFPGALVSYGGFEKGVQLLKGNSASGSENFINQSIEGVEYELANAIYTLSNDDRKYIGLVQGHGELDSLEIASFKRALSEQYEVSKVRLSSETQLPVFDALIVAKPRTSFSERDKFLLDQYLMQGGKLLFLVDRLEATMDSASQQDYFAFPYNLNLDDQFFKYGLRLNVDLIQDRASALYPVVTGSTGGKPQMQLMEWPFFPLVNRYSKHAITQNLDAVVTKFVSSIDTVRAEGIKKTPFMYSSQYARTLTTPVKVNINDVRKNVNPESFSQPFIPIGYLLEGSFTSLYKNRFVPEGATTTTVLNESKKTKMVVIADGDLARNEVNPKSGQPLQLGFDPFSNYTFANEELLLNAVGWLVNEDGLLTARTKEVKIRPLEKERVRNERVKWQIINLVLPLLLIATFGFIWSYRRKRKFANFKITRAKS
jgi:ABC-2 type transport system permease protein